MSLAYIITAYKQPSQFARLMDVLWHPDDHFAVHVDAKTSPRSTGSSFWPPRAAAISSSSRRFRWCGAASASAKPNGMR